MYVSYKLSKLVKQCKKLSGKIRNTKVIADKMCHAGLLSFTGNEIMCLKTRYNQNMLLLVDTWCHGDEAFDILYKLLCEHEPLVAYMLYIPPWTLEEKYR